MCAVSALSFDNGKGVLMHKNSRASRRFVLVGTVVFALLAGGCAGSPRTPSGTSPAPRPKTSSTEHSATPPPAPNAKELAMLSVARQALPGFTQRDLENSYFKDVKGIDVRTLTVRMPDVDSHARGYPKHFDPARPIFSQLSTAPTPPEDRDAPIVGVVTPDGTTVGYVGLLRSGKTWMLDGSGFGNLTSRASSAWPAAERKLVAELGGSLDETAAVGAWLLGRKGSHEAGVYDEYRVWVITWPRPQEGRVYSGAELVRWFGSYGKD